MRSCHFSHPLINNFGFGLQSSRSVVDFSFERRCSSDICPELKRGCLVTLRPISSPSIVFIGRLLRHRPTSSLCIAAFSREPPLLGHCLELSAVTARPRDLSTGYVIIGPDSVAARFKISKKIKQPTSAIKSRGLRKISEVN